MSWDELLEDAARFASDNAARSFRQVELDFLSQLDPTGEALDAATESLFHNVLWEAWWEQQSYCKLHDQRTTAQPCPNCEEVTEC